MATLHQSLTGLGHWKAQLALFAAGALMTFGFAPYHIWPVIFISLPVFYVLLNAATSLRQALWRGFAFGYGYFMAGTWWIANALLVDADKFAWLLPISILGLSAVMALWFVLFGCGCYCLRGRMSPLLFTALWLLMEILRSLGIFGFPWNLVGYMSLAVLPFAQVASLVGVYGLTFVLVAVGLLPIYWLRPFASQRRGIIATIASLVVLMGGYGFGVAKLATPTAFTNTRLRIVQPNIPQEVKGTPQGRDLSIQSLGELSERASVGAAPDVTIWPETAYPFTIRPDVAHPLPDVKGVVLTGAVRAEGFKPQLRIWNSLVAMDAGGAIQATYDKHQLVPFGEFVPLRRWLPLDKITPGDLDYSRGAGVQTLRVGGLPPFSPIICYEVIFSWMAASPDDRPAWILNVTNDGWYGDSAGPYQHFDAARMRAIEQGLPLVRAANSGISALIDGRGRVIQHLKLHKKDIIDSPLPVAEDATLYTIIVGAFLQPWV